MDTTSNGPISVGTLLDNLIGDTSSDYSDGDNPGYYTWWTDPEEMTLVVEYEADDPRHSTRAVFILDSIGPLPQTDRTTP